LLFFSTLLALSSR